MRDSTQNDSAAIPMSVSADIPAPPEGVGVAAGTREDHVGNEEASEAHGRGRRVRGRSRHWWEWWEWWDHGGES